MGNVWESLEAIPSQYRWAMIPVILGLLWGGYWYFLRKPQAEEIARLEREIALERRTLIEHRKIAAKYDAFWQLQLRLLQSQGNSHVDSEDFRSWRAYWFAN